MQLEAESLFRKIKRALDEEDIEGLLALGSPRDEYDAEASLIEDRIHKATESGRASLGIAEISEIVEAVWNAQFGPLDGTSAKQRRPYFEQVARKIIDAKGRVGKSTQSP